MWILPLKDVCLNKPPLVRRVAQRWVNPPPACLAVCSACVCRRAALDTLMQLGIPRVLTSGGRPSALEVTLLMCICCQLLPASYTVAMLPSAQALCMHAQHKEAAPYPAALHCTAGCRGVQYRTVTWAAVDKRSRSCTSHACVCRVYPCCSSWWRRRLGASPSWREAGSLLPMWVSYWRQGCRRSTAVQKGEHASALGSAVKHLVRPLLHQIGC